MNAYIFFTEKAECLLFATGIKHAKQVSRIGESSRNIIAVRPDLAVRYVQGESWDALAPANIEWQMKRLAEIGAIVGRPVTSADEISDEEAIKAGI